MAFSQFPAPAAGGGSTDTAFSSTITDLQTTYEHEQVFVPGIYGISIIPNTTNAQVVFVDESSILQSLTTTVGVATTQLSTTATKVYITTKSGGTPGAVASITRTGAPLTPDDIGNGTLDTVNTTGAYNETGLLSVLIFGGGAAGAKGGIAGDTPGGAGGRAGGVASGFVYNNGATTITIGAKGVAAVSNNTNITTPTESSFGNIFTSSTNDFFFAGNGGNIVTDGNGMGNVGLPSFTFPSFNTTGTTGGGGAGASKSPVFNNLQAGSAAGAGSGIGTGGTSAVSLGGNPVNHNPTVAGLAGTGKASGGGGGNAVGENNANAAGRFGGDGADGVAYILRGF